MQRLGRFHPRRGLNDRLQRLDDLHVGLLRCAKKATRQHRLAWKNLTDRLSRARPAMLLKQRREIFQMADQRLHEQARHRLDELKNRLGGFESRLRLLGPEQVLGRGYSITTDARTGRVLRAAIETKSGQQLKTRLKEGEVQSMVTDDDSRP